MLKRNTLERTKRKRKVRYLKEYEEAWEEIEVEELKVKERK